MPIKLIVALILLALAAVSTIAQIADGAVGSAMYLNLALKVLLVAGLVRGSEAARTFALVVGGLNVLIGVFAVVSVGAMITYLPLKLQVMLFVPLVFGGYLLWCMQQEDVKAWLYRRAYGRIADED